ncbi:choice-of-anchor H family protein [Thalassotalea montiporae]
MNTEITTQHSANKARLLAMKKQHKGKHAAIKQLLRKRQANRQEVRWFKFVACIWCLLFIALTAEANEQTQHTSTTEEATIEETSTTLANQLLAAEQPSEFQQIKVVADYTRELQSIDNDSNSNINGVNQLPSAANQKLSEAPLLPVSTRISRAEHQAAKALSQLPTSKQKIEIKAARSFRQEFSIFDAVTRLFDDIDADGFFRTFSVTFDADVYTYNGVNEALVYADIYLRQNGRDWEYFYSTDNFMIFGESTDDQYEVLSTLASGYQTDHYDVLIDLYQVGYSNIVATYSSDDSSSLYALPLESENYDVYYEEEIHVHGGSFAWFGLAIIGAMLWRRRSQY